MTQQKQNNLTNWLLGITTTVATGSFLFAWNTNAMLSVLKDHDAQHIEAESSINSKINDLQISKYDMNGRLIKLETKTR